MEEEEEDRSEII